jgi:hypothetical protein
MTTVTANDVRALAVSGLDRPVLALVGDDVQVISESELPGDGKVIITQEALAEDVGVELADFEAELVAGRLTADLTPGGDADPASDTT